MQLSWSECLPSVQKFLSYISQHHVKLAVHAYNSCRGNGRQEQLYSKFELAWATWDLVEKKKQKAVDMAQQRSLCCPSQQFRDGLLVTGDLQLPVTPAPRIGCLPLTSEYQHNTDARVHTHAHTQIQINKSLKQTMLLERWLWLRALAACLEDWDLIPSTHLPVHSCITPLPGDMISYSGLWAQTHMQLKHPWRGKI